MQTINHFFAAGSYILRSIRVINAIARGGVISRDTGPSYRSVRKCNDVVDIGIDTPLGRVVYSTDDSLWYQVRKRKDRVDTCVNTQTVFTFRAVWYTAVR